METTLHTEWTVADICKGFCYDRNEEKGLRGMNGKLVIQPEYQRNYVYKEKRKDTAVIESLLSGYPLGLMYFVENDKGEYEVLDGQQRITSFARFVTESDPFSIERNGVMRLFSTLDTDERDRIANTHLTIYVCKGKPSEIQQWFSTVNMVGVELTAQERLNASYHGPFITNARKIFSNAKNGNMPRWRCYVKGNPARQEVLETALEWVGKGDIQGYLTKHRNDPDTTEIVDYFESVIGWAGSVFRYTRKSMCGLDWGRLYEKYHNNAYDVDEVERKVSQLMTDPQIFSVRGVYEYVLSGCKDASLLNIRVFDERTKSIAYERQTSEAKMKGESNCPLCELNGNHRIYEPKEMDADHVTAWSKGGSTDLSNCQMLCRTHNRAKGNK